MLLLAAAVATHFLATQFYAPMLEDAGLKVWKILDPLMVAGLSMALVAAFARKISQNGSAIGQSIDREYLEAKFTFYYSALMLLWNWFGVQWAEPSNDVGLVWTLVDSTLPLLLASTGSRLLRDE